jgi:hypothetical protein
VSAVRIRGWAGRETTKDSYRRPGPGLPRSGPHGPRMRASCQRSVMLMLRDRREVSCAGQSRPRACVAGFGNETLQGFGKSRITGARERIARSPRVRPASPSSMTAR